MTQGLNPNQDFETEEGLKLEAQHEVQTRDIDWLSLYEKVTVKYRQLRALLGVHVQLKDEYPRVCSAAGNAALNSGAKILHGINDWEEFSKQLAVKSKETYDAYRTVGFDESQAFQMTSDIQKSLLSVLVNKVSE